MMAASSEEPPRKIPSREQTAAQMPIAFPGVHFPCASKDCFGLLSQGEASIAFCLAFAHCNGSGSLSHRPRTHPPFTPPETRATVVGNDVDKRHGGQTTKARCRKQCARFEIKGSSNCMRRSTAGLKARHGRVRIVWSIWSITKGPLRSTNIHNSTPKRITE